MPDRDAKDLERQRPRTSKTSDIEDPDAEGVIHTSPGGVHAAFCHCRPKACLIIFPEQVLDVELTTLWNDPVPSTIFMPQSLSQVILHIVFSTKERRPWLDAEIRSRIHAYLATVCRDCDCPAYRVGGASDHIHIATRLSRTISQAGLLEKIKKTSSAWIKHQGNQYSGFFWQAGYRGFSIGQSQLEKLLRYIERQEEHHRTHTFQEEYRNLLRKYHIEFDERYIWD